eukprot:CCRYP_002583-RA/>CCRYP_002583-RA protein AED:0.07 eAED:-0.07 QI:0/-1/0/1/-1/1/1/0/572
MATVALESCPLDDAIDSNPSHEIYVSALQAEVPTNMISTIDTMPSDDGLFAPCAPCSVQEASEYQEYSMGTIVNPVPPASSYVCEWTTTRLRLPSPPLTSQDERKHQEHYLCLPVHVISGSSSSTLAHEECTDFLYQDNGTVAYRLRLLALNEYLAALPALSSHKFFETTLGKTECEAQHRLITANNSGRVINVLQGEIAHATPHQADVLVSDDATTCHIVALRSVCNMCSKHHRSKVGTDVGRRDIHCPLATMSHIDGTGYEACIREAVMEHVRHHSRLALEQCSKDKQEHNESWFRRTSFHDHFIEISMHIVGGFEDDDGSSIAITDDILGVFSRLAKEFEERVNRANCWEKEWPRVSMILETCVVSGANDDGTGCPMGRGLGLNVSSGEVFLAEVDNVTTSSPLTSHHVVEKMGNPRFGIDLIALDGDLHLVSGRREDQQPSFLSAEGPDTLLRSMRLWAAAFYPSNNPKQIRKLVVIHRPDDDSLTIEPFFFGPHPYAKNLLRLNDANLLQATSTSPMVEKSNFVSKVRDSLEYMNETTSSNVFEILDGAHQPLEYRRVGLNGWVRWK